MPDGSPTLRLSPGSVPEATQLAALSEGLSQVRSIIRRETIGAVSPQTQLFAVDALMQQHYDAIAALVSACVNRNDSILAPEDAVQMLLSILEHVTMASYWVTLARQFREIPRDRPVRTSLSISKSRDLRMAILDRIKSHCSLAFELMDQLNEHAENKAGLKPHLDSVSLQILCVQINATLSAWRTASGGPPLPKTRIHYLVDQLDVAFSESTAPDSHDQNLVWNTRAMLGEALGDREMVRSCLNERRTLMAKDDDDYPRFLGELLAFAESIDEYLESVAELRNFAISTNLGPLFSRERVGRMSILEDTLWNAAISVGPEDQDAAVVFDQCFNCYEEWLFGRTSAPNPNRIRLFTSRSGEGRIAWFSGQQLNIRSFSIDLETAKNLYVAMEGAPQNTHRALRQAIDRLDSVVGPLLSIAIQETPEPRISAAGPIAILPILATEMNGRALGCLPEVAYAHPRSDPTIDYVESTDPFDLLVVDEAFASEAEEVTQSLLNAATARSRECRVVSFDSRSEATSLDSTQLIDALSIASTAVVFCHASTYVEQAVRGGIVLGPNANLTLEDLASANLGSVDELVLMNCGSGRSNPFVGEVTLAHAAALAGVKEICFSLWPIRSNRGRRVVTKMIEARSAGGTLMEYVSSQFESDRFAASSFAIMRM